MQPEVLKWLEDIRLAAERVQQFAAGRTARDYAADELLRSGIERQFAIVGEAMSHLRQVDLPTAERITNHRQIVAFRNRLVHRYWDIRPEAVWQYIEHDLSVLISEVRALIAEGDPSFGNPPAGQPQPTPPRGPQVDQ
jgi:uncharacterized protein with HEPN domain